jgi:hypothetical protein
LFLLHCILLSTVTLKNVHCLLAFDIPDPGTRKYVPLAVVALFSWLFILLFFADVTVSGLSSGGAFAVQFHVGINILHGNNIIVILAITYINLYAYYLACYLFDVHFLIALFISSAFTFL